jgi:hypothetical protein
MAAAGDVFEIQSGKDEAQKGCNAAIKQLAAATIPVLQEHLNLAQAALAAVGRDHRHDRF